MQTISFYSFKGGVGRSSLVYNLGYELASRGRFVVIADWDLHAPGLTALDELAMNDGPQSRKGVLDFLISALSPAGNDEVVQAIDPKNLAQQTRLAARARKQHSSFGDLFFIPAGVFNSQQYENYPTELRRLRLTDLAAWRAKLQDVGSTEEQSVLSVFRDRVSLVQSDLFGTASPDYLLLDSRTGITEIGDVLLGPPVDHSVIVFGLNEQNLIGLDVILEKAMQLAPVGELSQLTTLVASPVPLGDDDLLAERLATVGKRLQQHARPDPLDGSKLERMPPVFRIPYHPRLALREELMVERYPDSGPSVAYRLLADHITTFDMAPEQLRARTRGQVMQEVAASTGRGFAKSPRSPSRTIPPAPFDSLPSWNWPAPELELERVMKGEPKETRQRLLDHLAWSIALSEDEKRRIIESSEKLPTPRIAILTTPLEAERVEWRDSWPKSWPELQEGLAKSCVQWVEVLASLGHVSRDEPWRRFSEILPVELSSNARFCALISHELARKDFGPLAARVILPFLRLWAGPALLSSEVSRLVERVTAPFDLAGMEERVFLPTDVEYRALIAALKADLNSHSDLLDLAETLIAAEWTEAARQCCDLAWSKLPHQFSEWTRFAKILHKVDDLSGAAAALDKQLSKTPRRGDLWALLGNRLSRLGRIERADEAFENAVALEPEDAAVLRLHAVHLAERKGRPREARELLRKAISLEPEEEVFRLEDAEYAIVMGDEDGARQRLDEIAEMLETSLRRVRACLDLALCLRRLEPPAEAAQELIGIPEDGAGRDYNFDHLLQSLNALPAPSLELLRSATRFARAEIDVATFTAALEKFNAA